MMDSLIVVALLIVIVGWAFVRAKADIKKGKCSGCSGCSAKDSKTCGPK